MTTRVWQPSFPNACSLFPLKIQMCPLCSGTRFSQSRSATHGVHWMLTKDKAKIHSKKYNLIHFSSGYTNSQLRHASLLNIWGVIRISIMFPCRDATRCESTCLYFIRSELFIMHNMLQTHWRWWWEIFQCKRGQSSYKDLKVI